MLFKQLAGFPVQGKLIIEEMSDLGYKVDDYNIVYLEGIDTDLTTPNQDTLDYWNDVRCIVGRGGEIFLASQATTEPGRYYTNNPLNPNGAARLSFAQYIDCWQIGDHRGQDALVQCSDLIVCRDLNQDGSRKGDKKFWGSDFGLNQHTTSNAPDMVGRWSAGCLVGRYPETHATFMRMVRKIMEHMGKKKMTSTLLDGSFLYGT